MSLFGLVFLHKAESSGLGICKALFGRDVLIETFPWPYVDTMIYALPISIVVLIVVSLVTPKLNAPHVRRCFKK